MTERPRPRPRPRPVQKLSTTTATSSSSSTTKTASFEAGSSSAARSNATTIPLSSPNGAAKRTIVVEDTDEMFMRNRNRSSKTWQKLEQLDRQIEITEVSGSEEDEDDENLTPRRRKRAKAASGVVPVWQKSQELARMLSQEISDSSDEDDSNDIVEITPTGQRHGKRKRPRSRSKSITPPPALPAHHIQNAKRIVRQTLEATLPIQPPSPTADLDLDDSTDSNLQPEFMALVQRVRNESRSGSTITIPDGIPGEELLLIVKWHPHPLATDAMQQEWQYKVDKTDSFRDLFEAVAEDAGVQQANVILTYQGKRFYPSVTPHILRIWSDTAIFNAYEKTAYAYIQTNQQKAVFSQPLASPRSKARGASNEPIDINTDSEDDTPYIPRGSTSTFRASTPPCSQTQTQPLDSDSDSTTKNLGKTLKLVLRSALTGSKEITLTVRTTTRCDAVVKAFIRKAGLGEDKYPELFEATSEGTVSRKGRKSVVGSGKNPQLSLDGDKFGNDTQIGQTDLQDGDMVEVLGL